MSKRFSSTLLLVLFITLRFTSYAASQGMAQIWQQIELGTNLGGSNIWCTDLNGDGKQEILLGGGANQFFAILEYSKNDYTTTWISKWYGSDPIRVIELSDIDRDGENEIYVLLNSGKVEVYLSSTMELDSTYQTQATGATSLSIGDVDGDDQSELIITNNSQL